MHFVKKQETSNKTHETQKQGHIKHQLFVLRFNVTFQLFAKSKQPYTI